MKHAKVITVLAAPSEEEPSTRTAQVVKLVDPECHVVNKNIVDGAVQACACNTIRANTDVGAPLPETRIR